MTFKEVVGNCALALGWWRYSEDMTKSGYDVGGVDITEFVGGAFIAPFEIGTGDQERAEAG